MYSTIFTVAILLFSVLNTAWASDYQATFVDSEEAFNPRAYPTKKVSCKAYDRSGGVENEIEKDIEISYVELNPHAERTLLLVHGWPSLWSSWSNQIQYFQSKYRLIVPDIRGFGGSTHPGDVESSGPLFDIISDLTCVLDDAGVKEATCIGHDWGAQVCWESGRLRPDIFHAVAGITVPYIPPSPHLTPTRTLASLLPHLTYQIYFEERTSDAIKELNKDIRRTLRGTLRDVASPPPPGFLEDENSFLGAWDKVGEEIPPIPFLSSDEEDYFVEQYSIQGFDYTLQFYTHTNRVIHLNHILPFLTHENATLSQPTLFISPSKDPVADWKAASHILGSEKFLPKLTTVEVEAAHWPQLERPHEVNIAIDEWLEGWEGTGKRVRDEL